MCSQLLFRQNNETEKPPSLPLPQCNLVSHLEYWLHRKEQDNNGWLHSKKLYDLHSLHNSNTDEISGACVICTHLYVLKVWHNKTKRVLTTVYCNSTYFVTSIISIWFETPVHCAIFIPANSSDCSWCQMILKIIFKLSIKQNAVTSKKKDFQISRSPM